MLLHGLSTLSPKHLSNKKLLEMVLESLMHQLPAKGTWGKAYCIFISLHSSMAGSSTNGNLFLGDSVSDLLDYINPNPDSRANGEAVKRKTFISKVYTYTRLLFHCWNLCSAFWIKKHFWRVLVMFQMVNFLWYGHLQVEMYTLSSFNMLLMYSIFLSISLNIFLPKPWVILESPK